MKLVKVYITHFTDNSKWTKKGLKVKIFLNLFGTYEEVCQMPLITTAKVFKDFGVLYKCMTYKDITFLWSTTGKYRSNT